LVRWQKELLPPHFQLRTSATAQEREKLRTDVALHMPNIRARFGHADIVLYPCTFGVNKKGGMNTEQLCEYITHIRHLCPDTVDAPGKRILIKVDCGPVRYDEDLLVWARTQGIISYPGVPSTMAVTQETDQLYGPFNFDYYTNLEKLILHGMQSTGSSGQPSLGRYIF
jgi:hypothetical protein